MAELDARGVAAVLAADNLLLFTVASKSKRVYEGGWADTFDMQLTWKDEKHLVITKRAEYTSGEEFTDIEINLNTVE